MKIATLAASLFATCLLGASLTLATPDDGPDTSGKVCKHDSSRPAGGHGQNASCAREKARACSEGGCQDENRQCNGGKCTQGNSKSQQKPHCDSEECTASSTAKQLVSTVVPKVAATPCQPKDCQEGKCGKGACEGGQCQDGKCEGDKCKEGKCADGKCADGKCEGAKCADAKCADAKCADAKCEGAKCEEGKCVGGQCKNAADPKFAAKTKPDLSDNKKCEHCTGEECKEACESCLSDSATKESATAAAGKGHGLGPGMGRGRGMGHGHQGDAQHDKDHQDFFFLLDHRDLIERKIKNLSNGYEAVTESDDPEVAKMIKVHVNSMYKRVETQSPIRMRDPIFRAVFANASKINMDIEQTERGVRVKETSEDAYVAKLLQAHARVVSLWLKNGYAELPKNHPAPAISEKQ